MSNDSEICESGVAGVPATDVEMWSEWRRKQTDLGHFSPGGGELSLRNKTVSWLQPSRRQYAWRLQSSW